jgi:hypothetical protein
MRTTNKIDMYLVISNENKLYPKILSFLNQTWVKLYLGLRAQW